MSIESETDGGVSAIRVFDLSLDEPDNGIRIKSNGSRGGLTHDVKYDDVCVRDSPNPITLETGYSAAGTLKGDKPPTMEDILLTNVRVSGGGKFSFNGYDEKLRGLYLLAASFGFGAWAGWGKLQFSGDGKNSTADSTVKG